MCVSVSVPHYITLGFRLKCPILPGCCVPYVLQPIPRTGGLIFYICLVWDGRFEYFVVVRAISRDSGGPWQNCRVRANRNWTGEWRAFEYWCDLLYGCVCWNGFSLAALKGKVIGEFIEVWFILQGRFYSCTDEAKHTPDECKSVSFSSFIRVIKIHNSSRNTFL